MPPRLISFDLAMQPKNWKSFFKSSSEIPMPVSRTSEINHSSSKFTLTEIEPWKVNFDAFPKRLKSTCLKRFWSVKILWGTHSSMSTFSWMPFYSSWNLIMAHTPSMACLSSKNSLKMENLLFSKRLMSSASSITFCKWRAELRMILK